MNGKMIDADELRSELGIAAECENCPRYNADGITTIQKCKGHLMWMCKAIRACEDRGMMKGSEQLRWLNGQ